VWGVGVGRWEVKGGRRGLKTAEILLAESCRKQVSFESGFKQWKGRRISEAGWQRVPDRRCKKAEGTLSRVPVCLAVTCCRSCWHRARNA